VRAVLLQRARDLDRLVQLHAAGEAVAQVHLHDHGDVVASGRDHARDHLAEKAHAAVERAAVRVGAVVGIRGEELADEVTVAGVHLDGVEAGVAREVDGAAEAARRRARCPHDPWRAARWGRRG
jgi:hypothetical protein